MKRMAQTLLLSSVLISQGYTSTQSIEKTGKDNDSLTNYVVKTLIRLQILGERPLD